MKRYAIVAFKLLVSAGLLYFVLSRAGAGRVASALSSINPWAFALAVGLFILMIFLGSLRWGLLLPERFSLRRLFPLYMLGSFFNIFLPGLVGGDAVKVYYLYRETGKGAEALASVFMDRYLGYAGLMSVGILAYPFALGTLKGTPMLLLLPAVVCLFIASSLVLFMFRPGRGRFKVMGEIYGYFQSYSQSPGVLARAFGISLFIHVLSAMMVWVLSDGLGAGVPFGYFFVLVPIVATLSALPVSVSGIGIREAAMVLMLGAAGVSDEKATAVSFAWFLATAAGGLPGIVAYIRERSNSGPRTAVDRV